MANSGTVTAGSAALASQYNNLRDDVLNVSTGHTHTGASENGAKVAATGVASGTAANGAVLTADGSGAAAFVAAGASGGVLKYEQFTSSGSFVIPASASSSAIIVLEVVSGGVGGRGGSNRGSGTATGGGQAGPGGNFGLYTDLVSAFGTAGGTVTVTIGAGGAGGTATSVTGGNGGLGNDGGATSFGSVVTVPGNLENNTFAQDFSGGLLFAKASVYAYATNNTPSGTVTAPVFSSVSHPTVGGGFGYSSVPDYVSGIDYGIGGGGGGGGGGITTANVVVRSGNGGKRYSTKNGHTKYEADGDIAYTFGNGAVGGTAAGSAGAAGSDGDGGAGGHANTSGNGGVGGAGGQPGGGGGGGGACRTGSTSGAGGAGGAGRVRVWVIG